MATTAAGRGEMGPDEFIEKARRGILDDRLDAFVPLDLFGPPTEAELAEARLEARLAATARSGANGHAGAVRRAGARGSQGRAAH